MQLIARQVERREQATAPAPMPQASGIGGAIEAMIEQAVEERVAQALAAQKQMLADQQPKPRFDDFRQIPPTPRAVTPKAREISFDRDELGRVSAAHCGNFTLYCQRDELGRIIRFVPSDTTPMPPAVAPARINRKLYGNDEV
ncbi:hypothetical protein [Pseudomonas sp. BEA3.1]|uniref:hypothetical protein n=1 Tax=Pseudomonas sp. BEA3.1 TaxID=3083251 RepID=UPI0029645B18|nr:hypothetical protein [Pseudomonas sp. BEA3.1]MDW2777440.1 hypothetical protein [Pseudomonas sp. BEA3.1]